MDFFNGQTALITGAAHGLGRALASELARQGCHLILWDRDFEALQKLKEQLDSANSKIAISQVDLLDRNALMSHIETTKQEHPELNILINNAGTVFPGPFEDQAFENHERVIELNLSIPLLLTHEFLPFLRTKTSSYLVQIASASALLGFPYAASYAASKWGILGFYESLWAENQHRHFTQPSMTVACPSYIQTDLFSGARAPLGTSTLSPTVLAKRILKATAQRQFQIIDPWLVRQVPLLKAFLPFRVWQWTLKKLGVSTGMLTWKGRSH